jgi:hypothetical protein
MGSVLFQIYFIVLVVYFVVSMDITEFNPLIGSPQHVKQTCDVCISLLRCVFGHNILNVQL